MDFRTKVSIPKSLIQIEPFASIQCIGSCFANNIGKRFTEELFVTQVNPDGVMYNPASVFHSIKRSSFIPDYALLTLGTNHVYILKETNEIVDNCQKLKIITGKVKTKAENVIETVVLISKNSGKNLNKLLKNFSV